MTDRGAGPTTDAGVVTGSVAGRLRATVARDDVRRRAVHAGGAVFPLAYLAGLLSWPQLRFVYLGGLVLAAVLEGLRLGVGLDWWIFRELTREYEREALAGYALYVVGSAVAVWAFAPPVAVPAVLMLVVVDPVSGLLSAAEFREWKRPAVLAVAFLLSFLIAAPFVPAPAAALGALATTVVDGGTPVVRGHVIDDNLTIPIGAGLAMWVGVQVPV